MQISLSIQSRKGRRLAAKQKLTIILALSVALYGCASGPNSRLSECEFSNLVSEAKLPPLVLLIDSENPLERKTPSSGEALGEYLLMLTGILAGTWGLALPKVIPVLAEASVAAASNPPSCKAHADEMADEVAKWARINNAFLGDAVRRKLARWGRGSVQVITIATNGGAPELTSDDDQKLAGIRQELGVDILVTAKIYLKFVLEPLAPPPIPDPVSRPRNLGGCGTTRISANAAMAIDDHSATENKQRSGYVWLRGESEGYQATSPGIYQAMAERSLDGLAQRISNVYVRCAP